MNRFPKRKSMRLRNYDYSTSRYYFVTICTNNREELFGSICSNGMELNNAGEMVDAILNDLPQYISGISIDQYVVMPNHTHAIIIIKSVGGDLGVAPLQNNKLFNKGRIQRSAPTKQLSLPDIIQRLKMITTKKYADGVKNDNWQSFNKHLWQRSFYDHIIRNEESLRKIREYIMNNPAKWDDDENNLKNYKLTGQACLPPTG